MPCFPPIRPLLPPANAPNVLIVLLDDVGFGASSAFGGPIQTPHFERLAANGLVELGAHTHTHADFRGQPKELAADLKQNLTFLRERFEIEHPPLAFPYGTKEDGFVSDELVEAARASGVSCALSTEADIVRHDDSPYSWGRIAAEEHDSARTLAARLGGWQAAIRRCGRRIGGERF